MATEEEKQQFVAQINQQIDRALNGPELPGIDNKRVGFVLMIFPTGAPPNVGCTITSNTGFDRAKAAELFRAQADLLDPPKAEEKPN